MKKFVKILKFAPALLMCQQAMATTETIDIKFTTLPEITISEEQAMSFGQVLTLGSGDTCTMDVSSTNTLLAADELEPGGGLAGTAGTPGTFTAGTCAGATPGTPGIYRIASFPGANVDVTVSAGSSAGGEITFSPIGYVIDYNAESADNSTRETVAVGTVPTVTAPFDSDDNIVVIPGTNVLGLGGLVTNNEALSAEETFTVDFDVVVTYQ